MSNKQEQTTKLLDEILKAEEECKSLKIEAEQSATNILSKVNEKIQEIESSYQEKRKEEINKINETFQNQLLAISKDTEKSCVSQVNKLRKSIQDKKEDITTQIVKEIVEECQQ
jgi:F0F1-type ATP synthase membrane subunit b/b'